MLNFLMGSCTQGFLEIQNDFGFTPLQAVVEKADLIREVAEDIEILDKAKESSGWCSIF